MMSKEVLMLLLVWLGIEKEQGTCPRMNVADQALLTYDAMY